MNEYDVSVIIPVYNCEKYLKDCVKSILNQDYEKLDRIQVILIDDGSTDNSLKECNRLKETINELTIDVIEGKNEGVSEARNKGIKIAKGKYIMYIDADDFVSKNAIRKLVAFFDKHYDEIDLVTYSFYRYMQDTKKKYKYDRSVNFNRGTDVYDLDKDDYYVVQPSMNVIVKNYFKENVFFDTSIKYHEDTKYNITIIMNKKKIGYVDEVKYIYRRYPEQVTSTKSNACYNFYDMMNLFEFCIENYTKPNGELERNIQALIVHVVRSKLLGKSQNLFPYFYDEQKTKNAIQQLKEVLKKVDNDIIVNDKNMDKYHKLYLLQLKGIKFDVCTNHCDKLTINAGKDLLDIIYGIDLIFTKFKVKNGRIKIFAYLKSPILFLKKPKLYVQYTVCNGNLEKEEIEELLESNAGLYKTNIMVTTFYAFEYEVNMRNVKEFEFKVKIDNNNMALKYYFGTWTAFNSRINSYKVYDNRYRVQYKSNKFLVTHPSKKTRRKDYIRAMKRYHKISPKINFMRMFYKTDKKIWIYNDRMGVFDNGYIQYKHDVNINDGIERYYAIDGDIENNKEKFTKNELKHVIKFGSLKHKILYLKSDKIITSFANLQEYCPFASQIGLFKDILKYDLIYLQHGVLHATALQIYSKEFTPIDKIVISSNFEEENFVNKYNYSPKDLIKSGMPRLDGQNVNTKVENRIIFAPSWRDYLIRTNGK